ncbi:protein FAM177A1 [Anguilla anguilla]|uniref:protein FAM177A1 n=1 Tax=Anguilla anguilla TaxID=7936 RepID=UPI0015ADA450|nr:protein FAM177A1 [Anguilla anguilla]
MSEDRERDPSFEETEFGGASVSQRKKVIHFANGDTLEQDSSDGEEATPRKEPFSAPDSTARTSWREYSWRLCVKAGKKSIQTCDFIGEKLANLAGLNMAKYQYAIDQFHRDKTEGSKGQGTDEAPCVEEGAETIQLSPRKSADYGATEAPGVPGLWVTSSSAEHSRRTKGSHNKGYQED